MKPIGKTYLVKVKIEKDLEQVDGIYLPNFSSVHDTFYEAYIYEYGTGWTDKELKEIKKTLPIGKKVYINYKDKSGFKLVFGSNAYYIIDDKKLIAMED